MKHLFYLASLIALLYEISSIYSLKRCFDFRMQFHKKAKTKLKFDEYSTTEKSYAILHLLYWFWSMIGLCTFQYLFFLGFILWSLIPKRYIFLAAIDHIISAVFLIFIILNAYHFKITLI